MLRLSRSAFRLMGQEVGLADLKRAFPAMGANLQQLLDYTDGSVETTFGLCMQVCYHRFAPLRPLRFRSCTRVARGCFDDTHARAVGEL